MEFNESLKNLEKIEKIDVAKKTIKDFPIEDRPQEKLFAEGEASLSNAELIALIIRTGTKEETAVELCQKLLNAYGGIGELTKLRPSDIMRIKGFGPSKAAMVSAALELARRISTVSKFEKLLLNNPMAIYEFLSPQMSHLPYESFRVLSLDTKKCLIKSSEISKGTLDATVVHPREVFREAIEVNAHSIIISHNHPSGDPVPSQKDRDITNILLKAGDILNIELVDHIVIGRGKYFSFREEGILFWFTLTQNLNKFLYIEIGSKKYLNLERKIS